MRPEPSLLLLLPLWACGADAAGSGAEEALEAAVPGDGLVLLPPEVLDTGPRADPELERAYFHSFGNVRNGEVVSHVFRMRNSDARPVSIQSIKPGCGCTVPTVRYRASDGTIVQGKAKPQPGEPMITIPPQGIAEVELEIDTMNISTKNADKTIQTTVTTDSPNGFYVKLETHILVEVPFHLVPYGINFGGVPVSAGGRGSMDVVLAPGYDLELGQLTRVAEGLSVELERKLQPGRPAWTLTATLHAPLEPGRWNGEVEIATRHADGEPDQPLVVRLQADALPDLVPNPSRFVFIANDRESRGEVVLSSLLPGHRPRVLAAELPAEHLDRLAIRFEPEEPDSTGGSSSWLLTMNATDPGAVTELLRGTLQVRLDDSQHPVVDVPYVVHPASR